MSFSLKKHLPLKRERYVLPRLHKILFEVKTKTAYFSNCEKSTTKKTQDLKTRTKIELRKNLKRKLKSECSINFTLKNDAKYFFYY